MIMVITSYKMLYLPGWERGREREVREREGERDR